MAQRIRLDSSEKRLSVATAGDARQQSLHSPPALSLLFRNHTKRIRTKCQRLGYCSGDTPTITEMFEEADDKLFSRVLANDNHVLQQYLTD